MTSVDRPLGESTESSEQEHSVSSGIAAVSGGLAGAMIGQLVGGRLGAAIGAVVGGVAGVTMGKEAGDAIHHTVEVGAQQATDAVASVRESAQSALQQAKSGEAIDRADSHAQTDSRTIDEQYEQGLQLSKQGKLSAAIAAFQSVVAQEPDYAEAHYNLGIVLGKQGFRAQGIEHIEKSRDLCRAQDRMREAANIDRILEKLKA